MKLKLFEEFISPLTSHSWNEVRDTMQNRLPFAIICFMGKKSFKRCYDTFLKGFDMCEESYSTQIDGKQVTLPCLFIMDPDQKVEGLLDDIKAKCKVHHVVIGKMKAPENTYYDNEGSSYEGGSDIETSLDANDFGNDDHYTHDSTHYKLLQH